MDFIITAIRIYEGCEPNLKKGLKDEWYLLSNRVHVTSQNKLEIVKGYTYTNNLWGKGINISAIVGSNGSGKTRLSMAVKEKLDGDELDQLQNKEIDERNFYLMHLQKIYFLG